MNSQVTLKENQTNYNFCLRTELNRVGAGDGNGLVENSNTPDKWSSGLNKDLQV